MKLMAKMGAALAGAWQYLQKDVREVAADIGRTGRQLAVAGGVAVAATVGTFAPAAHATGTYDTIVSAASWSDVSTGVVSIATAVAAVIVVIVGVKFLLRALHGR